VARASRLQVRSRSVAAIVALWFAACGVLAMRHEASVAHVGDRAGGFVHAARLIGHHAGPRSDIHGQRDPGADTGDCALVTASHQAASAGVVAPAIATALRTTIAEAAPRRAGPASSTDVLQLAPKTSPPAAI
jgi:hypothetical protein